MVVPHNEEILVPLAELAIDPEAPDPLLWAGDKQRPGTAVDLDRMAVKSRAKADRARSHPVLAFR